MALVNASTLTFAKNQIAVALTKGYFGGHLGIAFHTVRDGPKLIHLRFHKNLGIDVFPLPEECWVATVPELQDTNAKILVGVVRYAASRKQMINFGINLFASCGSFDSNGHYTAPRGSDGLTCATFVHELLRATGLPFLDLQTWMPRADDYTWGNNVCELLRGKATEEHIAAVRANINGLRLRPEEVMFAADQPQAARPVDFTAASVGGLVVMAALGVECPTALAPALARRT